MNKDKVVMEILHAKSRVGNRKEGKILCDTCKYNTNDFVRHPHCRWCDGRSKYVISFPAEKTAIHGEKRRLRRKAK